MLPLRFLLLIGKREGIIQAVSEPEQSPLHFLLHASTVFSTLLLKHPLLTSSSLRPEASRMSLIFTD